MIFTQAKQVFRGKEWIFMPNELPQLDEGLPELFVPHLVRWLQAIPIAKVNDDWRHLLLVSKDPLTDAQKETLNFYMPGSKFTIAGLHDYSDIHAHLGELIERYYPDEEPDVLLGTAIEFFD